MTIDEQIQWLEHKLDDCSASEGDVVDEIIATLKYFRDTTINVPVVTEE